jgi:hypothetical protein
MLKKFENSSMKIVAEKKSMSSQTPLGSVTEFVGRSEQKILTWAESPAHTSLKTTEFVTNNMVIVPHPTYSPDLIPCDFA